MSARTFCFQMLVRLELVVLNVKRVSYALCGHIKTTAHFS